MNVIFFQILSEYAFLIGINGTVFWQPCLLTAKEKHEHF